MSKLSFNSWLSANAGVLSVLGALVIFFSWTVTNTLGQRYARLKQSVETAESTSRLYLTLHELRDSLNSAAMDAVSAREAAERNHDGESPEDKVIRLRREYSRARLYAHQVNELMAFASLTLDFSADLKNDTETARRIKGLNDEIYGLYSQARDRDRAVEKVNAMSRPEVATLRPAVEEYVRFVYEDAAPRVAGLYEAIVDASNARHAEGRVELARLKRKDTWVRRGAWVLYVAGSLLALSGQYLDKVYKKKPEAAKPGPTDPP